MVVDPNSDVNIAAETIRQLKLTILSAALSEGLCCVDQIVKDIDLVQERDLGWCCGGGRGGNIVFVIS